MAFRKERDPIERVRKLLIDNDLADTGELAHIQSRVKDEVEAAVKESKAASQPPLEMLQANIYQNPVCAVMRGATSDKYIQATKQPYHS